MKRRTFLRMAATAAPALSARGLRLLAEADEHSAWRTYEVTTTVSVPAAMSPIRVWLPQPLNAPTPFQRLLNTKISCETGKTSLHRKSSEGLTILQAEFTAGTPAEIKTMHRVRTRDWSVALMNDSVRHKQSQLHDMQAFLQPTRYVPTDGVVQETAMKITHGASTDLEKTHAIYEWIISNTYRDSKVRGCGTGNIRPMLETGNLGGKCADLNALFVGLLKASGVPARDVYGVRLGPSALEDKSLGASSEHVERAQHCRAEVFLSGHSWVPMDPADVRKVILEEPPGHLVMSDPKVEGARKRLFGSWEMNWMAYNYAQDVQLPDSSFGSVPFFMYPQAETAKGRLDSLDPAGFQYRITSHQVDGLSPSPVPLPKSA